MHRDLYFAEMQPDEIAPHLYDKVKNYYDAVNRNGRMGLWSKCHKAYYALDNTGRHEAAQINVGGEHGELSRLKANHYRNLLQHLYVFVTQQKPSFEPRAINSDYKSQVQTILGSNIIEYYLRDKRLAQHFRRCVEYMIVYAEGFIELLWDAAAGEVGAVDPETGLPLKTGDLKARVYAPYDVIRQTRQNYDTTPDWYILRRWESRYELAASHPEYYDEILNYTDELSASSVDRFIDLYDNFQQEDDLIPVYHFYHAKTAACPNGREVKFLGADLVLDYKKLQTEEINVHRMAAFNQDGTSFGYSVSFDLLCVQEALDIMYSTILTNQSTFGIQNIWVKPGSNYSTSQIVGGLNLLESQEKPEPINLTNTPPEIFNFLQGLETLGEVLSGVNSVARGQPEASLKSGAALALVASQAVQFSNGLQQAYVQCLEDVATGIIELLKLKAAIPRTAVIAGEDNRNYIEEFTKDDLQSISRVIVDIGNPVTNTIAGRMEIATQLLQQGAIKDPHSFMQVLQSGRLEPVVDDQKTEMLLIQSENEKLRKGENVPVLSTDEHVIHIRNHRRVLADPEARKNPELSQVVTAHMLEHINALRMTDPALLNILGQAPMGAMPPQAGGQMEQQRHASPEQGNPSQVPAPEGSSPEIANNMPDMPANTPEQLKNQQ